MHTYERYSQGVSLDSIHVKGFPQVTSVVLISSWVTVSDEAECCH